MLHPFSDRSTRNAPCFLRAHWMAQEPWTEFKILLTICNIQVVVHIILISLCCLLFHFEICNAVEVFVTCWHIHWYPIAYSLFSFWFAQCFCLVFVFLIAYSGMIFFTTDSVLSHQTFPRSIFLYFIMQQLPSSLSLFVYL